MKISIEKKKVEAISRMKKMKIDPWVIKYFENDGLVSIHETMVGMVITDWAWQEEDLNRIKQFEEKFNALVYLIIRSYTNYGKMDSFLYVSDYSEDWKMDWDNLADQAHWRQEAYVYNHDEPDYSEIGLIGIVPTTAAGLQRIW